MNGSVQALTVFDDGSGLALYAGGNFTTAGGVAAQHIAKWNGSSWFQVGSGMDDGGWYHETIGMGKNRLSAQQHAAPDVFYGKNTPQGSKSIPESKRPAPSSRVVITQEPKPTPGGAIIPARRRPTFSGTSPAFRSFLRVSRPVRDGSRPQGR